MRTFTMAVLALVLTPAAAHCQTTVALPRIDVSASIGQFGAAHEVFENYTVWYHTLFTGVAAGYYWTTHVKTEVEFASAGEGHLFGFRETALGGAADSYVYRQESYRVTKTSIGQTYQFGRNAWIHPFVGAGVDIDRERHEVEQPAQTVAVYLGSGRYQDVQLAASDRTDEAVRARPFAKGGVKLYVSSKAFVTTELKLGIKDSLQQTVWKVGVGIDF
jgi:hypothetical protein